MTSRTQREHVDQAVEEALARLGADIAPIGAAADDLATPLTALAGRGKRMRAALMFAAHEAAGGGPDEAALRIAAALELFQSAALVHDDVLDRSDTRRGMPSVHRAIEATHRDHLLEGDAERHGINGAILAGDLALMACLGEVALAVAALPDAVGTEVARRFRVMASLCTAGQYLDVRLAATPSADITEQTASIVAVMRSKTASYTTEGPLALGAALAGLPPEAVDAWAAAGVPLGIAFQLRDDLLGVVGSTAVTGKPAGDDVRDGKRTLVLAEALRRADAATAARIAAVTGMADASDEAIADAIEAIKGTGAVDATERAIESYGDEARRALAALPMAAGPRALIDDLVNAALDRSM